jgi:hypothetical protein
MCMCMEEEEEEGERGVCMGALTSGWLDGGKQEKNDGPGSLKKKKGKGKGKKYVSGHRTELRIPKGRKTNESSGARALGETNYI